jgi:hypothetical protein
MSYPCIYNEEGTCKLHSTVYEHSWCVEGPCDDQTLSNGDRIRSMTDEELAELISEHVPLCVGPKKIQEQYSSTRMTATEVWLNWLKQETDHDTD